MLFNRYPVVLIQHDVMKIPAPIADAIFKYSSMNFPENEEQGKETLLTQNSQLLHNSNFKSTFILTGAFDKLKYRFDSFLRITSHFILIIQYL